MIITSMIGCLEHKSLLFKVTCKKTVCTILITQADPWVQSPPAYGTKYIFWAGVYKQGSIIHHLHCQIYLTSQIVKNKNTSV